MVLATFLLRQAAELRAAIRSGCEDYLSVQQLVRGMKEDESLLQADLEPPLPDPLVGTRLGGFEIVRRIGEGGMGIVYLATQTTLDREVAIKVLPAPSAAKQGRVKRFEREARAPAQLDHPGIVKILESHQDTEPRWYAMEYVAGRSLHEMLQELRRAPSDSATGLPVIGKGWITRAAALLAAVADAVDHAHVRGVIHRDIKPHNILVDHGGMPRLLDFGLALDNSDMQITLDGDLVGTPHYMSPEQARGDRGQIGRPADLYSLGVVLYEMLTLRRPIDAPSREKLLHSILTAAPTPLRRINPRVPQDLETICLKALEKNPVHRYATAADFARDLRHFLNHEAIEARPPPLLRKLALRVRQHRELVIGFLVGAVLLATAAFGWTHHLENLAAPKLTVTGADADGGALVSLRRVDEVTGRTGPKEPIGTLPIRDYTIAPGVWRIVVERPGVGFAEMTRAISSSSGAVAVRAWIRPTDPLHEKMRRIHAGPFKYGSPKNVDAFLHDEAREEETFWIDPCEVSCADFQEFLVAMEHAGLPHADPRSWKADYKPEWASLPVVGLTFDEALAYAEWSGKRLPTMWEWEKAARGTDGRIYPWGDDPEPLAKLFPPRSEPPKVKPNDSVDLMAALYAYDYQWLQPVDVCDAIAIGPNGLLHALGNAQEWTESVGLEVVKGSPQGVYNQRYGKGGTNSMLRTWKNVFGLTLVAPLTTSDPVMETGVRCAKSDTP